jgi:peptidoglycan-associated lipoprotein
MTLKMEGFPLSNSKRATILMSVCLVAFAAGCKKKAPIATNTAPPPPAPVTTPTPSPDTGSRAPVIAQFTAEPSSIERGQSATLRWSVSDATTVTIDPGLGTVQSNGSRQVFPSNSTTYRLTATGPAGNANGTATVSVITPQAPPPPPPPPQTSLTTALESVTDAYFDYDSSDIREDARNALTQDADALKKIVQSFPGASLMVEGHCDERGSAEYNLGLGDRRAAAAKEFLTQLGVPPDRLKTVSYGKERPQCTESEESCWQKNRRAHFAAGQ